MGGMDGEREVFATKVTFQECFASLTRCFVVVLRENARAESFFRELHAVVQSLFAFTARYQDVIAGDFRPHISQAIMAYN